MNTKIEALRRQHDHAEQMAAAIVGAIGAYGGECDASGIARLVGKLNALLRVHLAYEDTVLYPLLMNCDDAGTAELARNYYREMGELAPRFEAFVQRWSGPTMIDAMFGLFRDEALALLGDLAARIGRENDILYPLAKRVAPPLAA